MNLDKFKNKFRNKRILILGFGKEGRDTLKFLKKLFPKKVLGTADQKEIKNLKYSASPKISSPKANKLKIKNYNKDKWHLGKNYLKTLKNYDIVIKSPGIPFKILPKSQIKKITSQTELFFENCPGIIIGITGTKGKGTTASLIYKILKEGGKRTYLVGNIGKPALTSLLKARADDIFVYELSSHQLDNFKRSPKIAVLLNVFPAHLEHFRNFKDYIKAKTNITRYQTKNDYLIYNRENKIVREIAKKSKAKKIPIPTKLRIFTNIRIPLIGDFNLLNLAAAVTVAKLFKISDKIIIKAIKNFKPSPYRLECFGTFKGVKFYDDSASTVPESTIGAIEVLKDKLQTIILGGSECNISFQKLAKEIIKSKIKNIILFPTTGKKIWEQIKKQKGRGALQPFFVDNMKDAVRLAYENTQKGKICLLSPASPSFTLFQDYKERGDLFKKYVKNGKKRKK